MQILFVHQNMPGQYKHLAARLAADPANQVVFITKAERAEMPQVEKLVYKPARPPTAAVHHYVRPFEDAVLHGQGVARVADQLQRRGFRPDVVCAHPGWGEALFIKEVFPDSPLLAYCEFFYRSRGSDYGFVAPPTLDGDCRIRAKNAALITSLEAADWGVTPTEWQWRQHPEAFRPKISILHEGVDTDLCRPDSDAALTLPTGRVLRAGQEVVTYVARNLEPYRGFPVFMRAVAELCRRRPNAEFVIIGGTGASYGGLAPGERSWKDVMLEEVEIDPLRVHFLDRVSYDQHLTALRVSAAHVYLTYPFVLSWSFLEAMASGCLIVGSRTPPVEEVIRHGENGLLVDFHDPAALADAVSDALDRPQATASLRAAARATAMARYDLHRVCLPGHLRMVMDLATGRQPKAA